MPTLIEQAKSICDTTDDPRDATKKLAAWIRRTMPKSAKADPELYKDVTQVTASTAIHRVRSYRRKLEKDEAMAGGGLSDILGQWTVGNKNLGNATKEELEAAEASARMSAAGFLNDAEFYAAIARRMNQTQTVREKFSNEQLQRIWQNI